MNHLIDFQRLFGETINPDYVKERAAIMLTLQIERQLPGGSWALHGDGRKFKDPDAAWQLVYEVMAWLPGTRLRLRAFRNDPYESTAKYLYPDWIPHP